MPRIKKSERARKAAKAPKQPAAATPSAKGDQLRKLVERSRASARSRAVLRAPGDASE